MLLFLAALAAAAEPAPTPDPLVAKVEARYRAVDSLRARFVQVVRSVYGDETQTGTILVSRPDRMRWVFDGSGKLFVSDGKALWVYSPEDKQVVKFPSPGAEGASADVLLQSLDKLSQRFVVAVVSSDATGHVLSLTPRTAEEQLFKHLRLSLDPAFVVTKLELTDPMGTTTELSFREVVLGPAAPDSEFQFVPPPGVDVVDGS